MSAESINGNLDAATSHAREATDIAERFAREHPSSSAWGQVGTLHATLNSIERRPAHVEAAIDAFKQASALDPYGPTYPVRVVALALNAGRDGEARHWARIALERSDLQRLDPLRQLTPAEGDLVRRALASPAAPRPRP